MALDPAQHVRRSDSIPASLELTPEDYFVLSRIEGSIKVGDLVRSCGLPSSKASEIVAKLLKGGALQTMAPRPSPQPAGRSGNSKLRSAAQARKREALAAALRMKNRSTVERPRAQAQPEEDDAASTPAKGELERVVRRVVDAEDPRLDAQLPIEVERQRWILAMADGHESMSQFEILGILPTHDVKAIKRAYHETSRVLHPDAYHGRDLGEFRPMLASLFREAKASYAELRREDVRAPWVDRRIQEDAHARLVEEAEAVEAREEAEAAAAQRREARTLQRAARKRDALQSRMKAEAAAMLRNAEAAEEAGNLPKAANLYLLATRADPGNKTLEAKWKAVRKAAREKRGTEAYMRAQQRLDMGQVAEALPWLLEAADAMPTAEHLAHAAYLVRGEDATNARNLAMGALEAMRATEAGGTKFKPAVAVRLHLWIGHAFLAAGQVSTAKHQADLAAAARPDDPEVRALLKACKAK